MVTPSPTNTSEQIHPKGILVYYDHKNIYSVDVENQKVKTLLSTDTVLQDLTVVQGVIYFTNTTSKNNNITHDDKEIFKMKLDGSDLEQLTTGEIGLLTGVAPNGKYLTYIGMDSNLWLLDIENNMSEEITELKNGYDFLRFASWSPNSSDLLYFQVSRSDSEGSLFLYTIEDKKTKAILPNSIISFNLTWSPDSNKELSDISILNLENGEIIQVDNRNESSGYTWSYDEVYMIYAKEGEKTPGIYLSNFKNGENNQIKAIEQNMHPYDFTWSPNNTMILYKQSEGSTNGTYLFLLGIKDKKITNLAYQEGRFVGANYWSWEFFPTWATNGKFFAYITPSDGDIFKDTAILHIQSVTSEETIKLEIPKRELIENTYWINP